MTYGNVNVDTVTTSTPNGILGAQIQLEIFSNIVMANFVWKIMTNPSAKSLNLCKQAGCNVIR